MPFYFADAAGLEIRWCGGWWVCESSRFRPLSTKSASNKRVLSTSCKKILIEIPYWTHSKLIVFAVFVFRTFTSSQFIYLVRWIFMIT